MINPQIARSDHLVTEKGSLFYSLTGVGPAVCLVTTISGIWAAQVRDLHRDFRVLTYDMRGYGRSASRDGYPTTEEHAHDLALLLDHVGMQSCHIVGLSHGGLVAQMFASLYPQRLSSLVLVATLAKATGGTKLLLKMLLRFLKAGDRDNFWEVLSTFLISEARFDRVMSHAEALKLRLVEQYTAEGLASIYEGALRHDTTAMLSHVQVPTLVIGGSEDMLFPPKITEVLALCIGKSKTVLLPTAHVPPLEEPSLFNQTLREFLLPMGLES